MTVKSTKDSAAATKAPGNTAPHSTKLTLPAAEVADARSEAMDSIIYLVGLVVILLFILSALGLR